MDPSTIFLVSLSLLGLALVPIGFIVWGIALILGDKSTPEVSENIRFHKPGWVSTEAEVVDKGRSDNNYFVTYRFTGTIRDSSQIYTKTQPISADQYAALLKGSVTEVSYPPNRPNDAELVQQQATSIPTSPNSLPTYESVVNGVLLPFVFMLNLLTLGAFSQQGGPAPTSRLKLPMETTTITERGWSYVVGGVVMLLLFGGIVLAASSGQPAAVR